METRSQQRNIELTRLGFEAYNARDYEALARLLHPDVELHADSELVNSGDFRGHDGFMQWNAEWTEAWDEFTVDAHSVEAFGDHFILADSHQVARGAGSGIVVEMDVFWALEVEGRSVTRMHIYATRERALAAIDRWGLERESPGA